jgi:hypothetical protein
MQASNAIFQLKILIINISIDSRNVVGENL